MASRATSIIRLAGTRPKTVMDGNVKEETPDDGDDYSRDSYAELRKRFGVDNSDVRLFPYSI